jgi:protein O-GlcNAc transferase
VTAWVILGLALLQGSGPEAVARKAVEDFRAGRYAAARDGFRAALKYAPENAGLWAYLGLAEGSLNDVSSAIADLEKARSLSPQDPQILFDLGLLYGRAGNTDRARAMYRDGLKSQPDDPAANQNYALLLMQAGQYESALAPLQTLRTLQPNNLSVMISLIECNFKAGLADAAQKETQSFLQTPGLTLQDRINGARTLVEDHAPAAAEMVLRDTVSRFEESPEAHAGLGKLLLDRGEYEDAVRELARAAQLAPDTPGYTLALAEALILWKHYTPALQLLEAVRPKFGTLPDFRYKVGLALYGLSRYPEALSEFEKLAKERPQADLVWFFIGNTWLSMGKLDNAETAYRHAIALNPHNASYYAALGQMLRQSEADRLAEATSALNEALRLDRTDYHSKKELALCYERSGDLVKAQNLLEQATGVDPKFNEAHVALARVYYKLHNKAAGDSEKQIVAQLEAEEQARQTAKRKAPPPN